MLNKRFCLAQHSLLQINQMLLHKNQSSDWFFYVKNECALQRMKEGQRVELYIPAALGYGTQSQSSIPANSVLIFDLKLEKVIHPDGLESYSLKVD
jgi:hypothetical protein